MKNDRVFNWMRYARGCYIVSFHDGIKTNPDGSPFYDMRIRHNERELKKYIKKLESEGYKED